MTEWDTQASNQKCYVVLMKKAPVLHAIVTGGLTLLPDQKTELKFWEN